MEKQIVFVDEKKAELLDVESQEVGKSQVKVKTIISTISNGTEKASILGQAVGINSKPDEKAVFPRVSGYSTAGIVVEIGEDVESLKVGDRVAMCWSTHREFNVLDENNVVKIEGENVSLEEASMAHIATFPLAAIRKTKLEIGESLIVMGLGILGLLAITLAKAAGAVPVIAVDPVKERREMALKFGADYAFDPFDDDFSEKVKAVTDGGVNVAIEVTGQGAGLNETLDCMAKFGRVSLLGCTRNSDFSVDFYRKVHGPGITIVGAHTLARPEEESYPGYFTTRDDIKTVLKLCEKGRINIKDMVGATYSPAECSKVYDGLINDKNFPVVVQFDWDKLGDM